MPSIAFFIGGHDAPLAANDNHERLPRGFEAAGWEVARLDRESIAITADGLAADSLRGRTLPLAGFDRYFMLGFGARGSFLDRMQLLRRLDQTRFVNAVDAFTYLHGKATLLLACPDVPQPTTHVANGAEALHAVVRGGGEWIAKPAAGSFGRGVFRLRAGDANVRAILEYLTHGGEYALLQERLSAGPEGEKRALLVGGEIVGAYGKTPFDHRGNLGAGAGARQASLNVAERDVLGRLAGRLGELGARFATADVLAGRVLEVNVANPGWLGTCERVCGIDLTGTVVRLLAS